MEILDLVLQGLEEEKPLEEVERAIATVGQYIREYCGFEKIPPEVYPLWAEMTITFLQSAKGGGPDFSGVTSVAVGDVSYSFGTGGVTGMESLLTDYRHRLNKVRRGLFR